MARGRRRNNETERDDNLIPSLEQLLSEPLAPLPTLVEPTLPSPLTDLEDFRSWDPEPAPRTPRVAGGNPARVQVRQRRLDAPLSFNVPEKVAVCVRRKERREVLFATRRTRRGSGARRNRNFWSSVSCK